MTMPNMTAAPSGNAAPGSSSASARPHRDWCWPAPLRPGDRVALIAPSGPFDEASYRRGVAWLAARYALVDVDRPLRACGFLAGSDEERAAELRDALALPDVRAVIGARGGYGATRIVSRLDWSRLRAAPRWLIGFSDLTALHLEATRQRVASLHAANVTTLGEGTAALRAAWLRAVEHPMEGQEHSVPLALRHGVARGRLAGGNLTLVATQCLAGRYRPAPGTMLFLEDVDEAPYRVDRMLTALRDSGAFDGLAGLVLGDFTACHSKRHAVTVETVLAERLSGLGCPVAGGLRAGHGAHQEPLVLGALATLDTEAGTLTLSP